MNSLNTTKHSLVKIINLKSILILKIKLKSSISYRQFNITYFSPLEALSRADWTMASDSLSRADVASSSNKILGFLRMALAMATLCFWPPDIWPPPSPTRVSNFWNFLNKCWVFVDKPSFFYKNINKIVVFKKVF